MLQKFILNLLEQAVQNEKIRAFIFELVEKLGTQLITKLLPDILGTFPTFGASLLKTVFEKLPNIAELPGDVAEIATDSVKHLIDSDPDIPGLSDIVDLSELARKWLHL